MSKFVEIIDQYTKGEKTVEETNAALKEAGASFHLEPGKNELTANEIAATVVDSDPKKVNGWGLLDTGTGSFDKVRVVDGKTPDCDCGEMYAIVLIGGLRFDLKGSELVPYGSTKPEAKGLAADLDMGRKTELAGQVVEQVCKKGTYEVHYNELGYAVKAIRK